MVANTVGINGAATVGRVARVVVFAVVACPRVAVAWCVDVNLHFSPSEPSHRLVEAMTSEASSIWETYGVEIAWTTSTTVVRCAASLGSFDVLVDRHQAAELSSMRALGTTRVGPLAIDHVPVHVNRDLTEHLLASLSVLEFVRAAGHLNVDSDDVGRALGRVLAHEIGHVLLAVVDHRQTGLMRPSFSAGDLVRSQRESFTLSPAEVARLQSRERTLDAGRSTVSVLSTAAGEELPSR